MEGEAGGGPMQWGVGVGGRTISIRQPRRSQTKIDTNENPTSAQVRNGVSSFRLLHIRNFRFSFLADTEFPVFVFAHTEFLFLVSRSYGMSGFRFLIIRKFRFSFLAHTEFPVSALWSYGSPEIVHLSMFSA